MDIATLLLGVVFSSIGIGYFMYGKKQSNVVIRYCGIALMVYPYFIGSKPAIVLTGIALMALPRFVKL